MLTLPMLAEFLKEEGYEIHAIDDFDSDPKDPFKHTPWQAVGIGLAYDTSGAIEIVKEPPGLHVWVLEGMGPTKVLARIPLAHPQCFEKVVETLRGWDELISSKKLTP